MSPTPFPIGASFRGEGFFAQGGLGHMGTHALVGGILSDLQGGKFGHGFLSAGLVKGLAPAIGKVNGWVVAGKSIAQAMAAAIAGGTVSQLTGGKFQNGAVTGAFQNLFNQQSQPAANNKPSREINYWNILSGTVEIVGGAITAVGSAAFSFACTIGTLGSCGPLSVPLGVAGTAAGTISVVDGITKINNELTGRNDPQVIPAVGEALGGETGRKVGNVLNVGKDVIGTTKGLSKIPVGEASAFEKLEAANDLKGLSESDLR